MSREVEDLNRRLLHRHGLRDPFGNPIRILQQGKVAQEATA